MHSLLSLLSLATSRTSPLATPQSPHTTPPLSCTTPLPSRHSRRCSVPITPHSTHFSSSHSYHSTSFLHSSLLSPRTPLSRHCSVPYHSSFHVLLLSPLLNPRTPLQTTPLATSRPCQSLMLHLLTSRTWPLATLQPQSVTPLLCQTTPRSSYSPNANLWLCPPRPSLLKSPLLFLRTQHS